MPARNSTLSSDKIPTKTEWTRSKPIDITKRLPQFNIDTSNILNGTRLRKNINYHFADLTGKQIEVKRSSINSIEKRSKQSTKSSRKITKQKKM